MPNKYNFDEISITTITGSSVKSDRITIKDKERLNEFKDIFRGYLCKRSLESDSIIKSDMNVAFIDLVIVDNNRASPLHFIIRKDYMKRYTASNTDFIYVIQDDENQLAEKVFDFVNKYVKNVELK